MILGQKYKKTLAKHMEWVTQNPNKIQKLQVINVIRGEDFIDGNLVGAIASMISASNLLEKNKKIDARLRTNHEQNVSVVTFRNSPKRAHKNH